MRYFIGIDGGGTKTHCVIIDETGKELHTFYGGPSNFLVLGTDPVCETLHNLLQQCGDAVNAAPDEIAGALLGTTGAGRRSDAEILENAFIAYLEKNKLDFGSFRVESDARIALEAAFGGEPGSILIAGTGSIMFGKDASGTIHRVGGFGRFLGDEGSGYVIGKKGLVAVSQEFDGRGTPTLLTKLVKERLSITTPESLIIEIYTNKFDIASAAPLVIEAAEQNDPLALQIVEEETDNLVQHIAAMKKKITSSPLKVAFIGGIITNTNIFSDKFREKIAARMSDVEVKESEYSPAYGAALMARKIFS